MGGELTITNYQLPIDLPMLLVYTNRSKRGEISRAKNTVSNWSKKFPLSDAKKIPLSDAKKLPLSDANTRYFTRDFIPNVPF